MTYYVGASLFEETGVVHEDVPILPFEKAKTALESEIEKGLLREVVEMRLCYAPYYDPADQEAFYLLPVWYARGVYANSADKEFTSFTDSGGVEHMDTREYQELVFEAQKGKLMDWDDGRRSRQDVPRSYLEPGQVAGKAGAGRMDSSAPELQPGSFGLTP